MKEHKIARFVGIEACKSIFSEKSTFVLRSPEHYQRLYEINGGNTSIGDKAEGRVKTSDGGTAEFTGWIASCWTQLEGAIPANEEWEIFKENNQNLIAIVSTPSTVCQFLNNSLEMNKERTKRRFPFYSVEHHKVTYEKPHIDHTNITNIVPFAKNERYKEQKEYRFVLTYGCPNLIDSFIFCGGIDYIEQCFVNPKISKKQKEELQLIIANAMAGYGDFSGKKMGDIIANVDVLFDS